MYNEHFGLSQSPFRITPDTGLFFTGAGRGEVLEALAYAITSGEGIIKITGEVGTGKTMLCRMLENRLPENVDLVYLANPSLSPEDIVQAIALELGILPNTSGTRIELVFQLQQTLVQRHADNHRVVVLIEEAQSMPTGTLEEVRLLSNLETKREKLLQIVLFGQPELDEKLSQPEIRQLRERITHSFQLSPLVADEVRDYVNFRLRASGYRGRDAFTNDAFRAMGRASEGLTRRVNILADKALLAAYADDTHDVGKRHVNTAIKDSAFQRVRRGPAFSTVALLLVAVAAAGIGWFGARWLSDAGVAGMLSADATESFPVGPARKAGSGQTRPADDTSGTGTAEAVPVQTAEAVPVQTASRATTTVDSAGWVPASMPSRDGVAAAASVGIIARASPDVSRTDVPRGSQPLSEEVHDTASEGALEEARMDRTQVDASGTVPGADRPGTQPVAASQSVPEATSQPLVRTLIAALSRGDRQMMAPPPDEEAGQSAAPQPAAAVQVQTAGAVQVQTAGAVQVQTAGAVQVQTAGAEVVSGTAPSPSSVTMTAAAAPADDTGAGAAVAGRGLPRGDLLEQRLQVTEHWLDGIDPGHFTIQLLATVAGERDSLVQFLTRQRQRTGIESVYVYETDIGGRSWYSVVFGNFSSFSEARDALQGLPRDLARHSPFIRNLSDLRTRSG